VAAAATLAHVGFAFVETFGWGPRAVRIIAPAWVGDLDEKGLADHVDWAKRLAINIGAYNLLLALGLALTCAAYARSDPIAGSLAAFFAIWLLGAAAAGIYTRVYGAFIAQGLLGLLLLAAYIWA